MKHVTYDFNQDQTLTHTHNLSLGPKLQQAIWIFMQSMLPAMIHCRLYSCVDFVNSYRSYWC